MLILIDYSDFQLKYEEVARQCCAVFQLKPDISQNFDLFSYYVSEKRQENTPYKGRGRIRPRIGPLTFSRWNDLKTIYFDRFQHGEYCDAISMYFYRILNSRFLLPFYITFLYIFTSYFDSISSKTKYLAVIFLS